MASHNRVILLGNLTRDPELRYLQSGMAVTDIGVAVNDRRKNQAGEWVDEVTFVDVTVWGRTAEVMSEYLGKGSPVFIEGRLKLDSWESQDGQKRSKLKVICEKMQMVGGKGEGGGGGGGGPRPARQGAPQGQGQGQGQYNQDYQRNQNSQFSQPSPEDDFGPPPSGGDEIPF